MSGEANQQEGQVARAVETAIRLGAIFLMAIWAFEIIKPFVSPVVWGIIIAVAGYPAYSKLARLCGGRTTLAAVLFASLGLVLIITPTALLTSALIERVQVLTMQIREGSIEVPAPPAGVADWPVVGPMLHARATEAADKLETALTTPGSQLESLNKALLNGASSAGRGLLQFILSILIAGGVLANAEGGARLSRRLFMRLAPRSGAGFAKLAEATIRSVATGVIGVAVIQAALVGVGLFAIGAPGAPVLVLIALLMGIVQLPMLLLILPVIAWAWSSTSTVPALIFTVWSVAASLSDNVLKPILLGRGVQAPMIVIFLGAIGGFMASGIVGLFVGAVVLVLGYELFTVWLDGNESDPVAVEPSS